MCAMKYVFLFTFEREKESELECIAAYLSIFKVAILRRQQQKYRLYKNEHNLHPL